jgi:signal peptidase II
LPGRANPSLWLSVLLAILAFGLDRAQKFIAIDPQCIGWGRALCPDGLVAGPAHGWRGGEFVRVTGFFDYILVWNSGISYGLLSSVPVPVLAGLMVAAIIGLMVWWGRTDSGLIRAGLALAIGGALSNALDRGLYGAVADFFHFHWHERSFYVFNLADSAITLGVVLLFIDLVADSRRKNR